MAYYRPRHCKTCGVVMVKHKTLKRWTCTHFTCPAHGVPHYESLTSRKLLREQGRAT